LRWVEDELGSVGSLHELVIDLPADLGPWSASRPPPSIDYFGAATQTAWFSVRTRESRTAAARAAAGIDVATCVQGRRSASPIRVEVEEAAYPP
jgi:hypothetical protein